MFKYLFIFLSSVFLLSCGSDTSSSTLENNTVKTLSVDTTWYWQLLVDENHPLREDIPAQLYDIDLFDISSEAITDLKNKGKIVICYFSAGTYEEWRLDASDFPEEALGNPLDNWEGERWLDITNETVRQIMLDRLDLAVQKGCDGVEPDNIDGYTNDTGFNLTYEDQLEYNRFLAEEAHKRGLLIGLKNDLQQVNDLVDYFDFALNEQCFEFNECELLTPFVESGKPVFVAEYNEIYINDENSFNDLCQKAKEYNYRVNVYPLLLDGSFVRSCDYGTF